MKIIGSEPATPCAGYNREHQNVNFRGLTKREHFAAMAMQGYVSEHTDGVSKQALAEWAVGMADALIEALNKEE